jgi:hypothetical protein
MTYTSTGRREEKASGLDRASELFCTKAWADQCITRGKEKCAQNFVAKPYRTADNWKKLKDSTLFGFYIRLKNLGQLSDSQLLKKNHTFRLILLVFFS